MGDTTATLARLPGDFGVRQDTTTKMGTPDLDMAGVSGGTGEHGSDPITAEKVLSPITGSGSHGTLQRMLSTDSASSRRSRRSRKKLDANPMGAWMKTKIPQKGTVPVTGTFSARSLEHGGKGHTTRHHHYLHRRRSTMESQGGETMNKKTQGRVGFDLEANVEGAKVDVHTGTVDREPLRTQFVHDRTFGTSNSGTQRVVIFYARIFLANMLLSK